MERFKAPLFICKRKVSCWVLGVYRSVLDFFFPPLCRLCQANAEKLLCTDCADLLSLPDIAVRCRHCFAALEGPFGLCRRCAHRPIISAPRAYLFEPTHVARRLQEALNHDEALQQTIASLLIIQWSRLNWPQPDRIASIWPISDSGALRNIAEEFARRLDRKIVDEFRLGWAEPFRWKLERRQEDLLESQNILLIDLSSSADWMRCAVNELWPAFPKQIHILSVFEH